MWSLLSLQASLLFSTMSTILIQIFTLLIHFLSLGWKPHQVSGCGKCNIHHWMFAWRVHQWQWMSWVLPSCQDVISFCLHVSVCMCSIPSFCMHVSVCGGGGQGLWVILLHIAKLITNTAIFSSFWGEGSFFFLFFFFSFFDLIFFFFFFRNLDATVLQKVACKCRIFCSSSFPSTDPCAAGTFSTDGLSTMCTPCDENTYQNSTGQSSCINCPAKTYTTTIGATSAAACRRKWQT